MPDHRLPRTYRSDAQRTSAGRSPGALRTARLIALLAGFAGVLLCALAPLLPVRQTTATILWPQTPDVVGNITALVSQLGSAGLSGLIALGVVLWLFQK